MIFSHSLLRLFEKKKNTITVHRARHRAIAQNRRKNAPNRSLRSSMHVAEPSLPFLRAFAHLRASLRVTFSSTFSSLKPLFFCSYFFSFLSFFCFTFVFRVHSNDTISSASFVQEAKENLKKKPRSTVHATRKCAIRTIMSLEVRRVRRIYFAFRASRKCKIFLLASVFVGRPIFAFRAERISPAIALTRPFFRRITCQNI